VGNPPSTNPVTFEKLHALLLMLCVSVLSFLQERLLAAPSTDDAAHMDHMDPSSHIAGQPTSRRGMVRASGWWCHMCSWIVSVLAPSVRSTMRRRESCSKVHAFVNLGLHVCRSCVSILQMCCNCGTTSTSVWRVANAGLKCCNACGTYFAKHNAHRPEHLVAACKAKSAERKAAAAAATPSSSLGSAGSLQGRFLLAQQWPVVLGAVFFVTQHSVAAIAP
jgi:hypothetical protein